MFKRGSVWWTKVRYKGKVIQKSLETSDKSLAKSIESKIRVEIVEGKYFDKQIGENKTVSDMLEKLMIEHAPTVSVSMQNSYSSYKKNHLIPFFGFKQIRAVSPKMISRYKVTRKREGAKPATVNRELAMLSKAFSLAVKEWEWLGENPVSKVQKEKENNERTRWLSEDEEKRLIEQCSGWLKDIVIFDLNTGMRQDELLSLEWGRVRHV